LLTGEKSRDELIIERPDGSKVIVSAFAIPIKEKNGEIVAALGVFEDISEQKKVEEALKESEQRFRLVAEAANVLVYESIFGSDEIKIVRGLQELLGYRTENQKVNLNWWMSLGHPDDATKVNEKFEAAINDKSVNGYVLEYRIRNKAGNYLIVKDTAKIIRDDSGKPLRMIGGVRNVTERRELQHRLEDYAKNLEILVEERTKKIQEREQNYRELYDSFGEAFIATDWSLTVIHWNKAAERITTVKAKDALGKKIYDVLPEMLLVDITPYYDQLQEKKPTRFMMNTISRETCREAIFEISSYPSTLGIIVIVEDKTEEERTKRLSAIGQTAGMVGHDIRNPLQAIIGDLYLLSEEIKKLPQNESRQAMQESVESINQNTFYINKIVSDLQDYTRPIKPNLEEINVKAIIESAMVVANIPDKVNTEIIADKNLNLKTDFAYLRRVLTNLMINAVQAMPNGGKLRVSAERKESAVLISVEDTGIGIPEEFKAQIFTPLFTTKSKGQGFGLAVVKRLIEGLNGEITFESKDEKGTKFTIKLPANM
jgi:PAS domain S-box-containing protein